MWHMQFEYKALNLLDEISTVELTLDTINSSIHVFDRDGAVYPQFNFSTKQYEPNDEFWKMKENIEQKHLAATFFAEINEELKWLFYTPKKEVYCFTVNCNKMDKVNKENNICLSNYVDRL